MSQSLTSAPSALLQNLQRDFLLWRTLVAQELAARYRGTLLGRLWPLLLPLLMLALYGFIFGAVFRARWPGLEEGDHLGFVLNLYVGLLVHGLLSESVGQAPGLMQRHSNFVRKMVFPLPVLVAVPLGVALFHAAIGLLLLLVVAAGFHSTLHLSALAAPLILLPYLCMLYGISLLVAALGVYLRDLGQIISLLVTMALFTAPVFYPRNMVPDVVQGMVDFNPITWPVAAMRDAVLHGIWPAPASWGLYSAIALLLLVAGLYGFSLLRRGFADLL